jgi:ADP-ribose pyrophosphatase YjhB (NUDIX family)
MKENAVLISGAVVFKKLKNGKEQWLLIKQPQDSEWEIPKVAVRKGESSVRAVIRYMAESGGMNARVLEEVGRVGGSITINKKVLPRRLIYYLMIQKSSGEVLGFEDVMWLNLKKAQKKLSTKKEVEILKQADNVLKEWVKKRAKK